MRYTALESVETSLIGDRVVLYDGASRKAVVLNPTGALLWQQLKTPRSQDELAQYLQTQFSDVPAAQLQSDVAACVQSLLEQKLLREEA